MPEKENNDEEVFQYISTYFHAFLCIDIPLSDI